MMLAKNSVLLLVALTTCIQGAPANFPDLLRRFLGMDAARRDIAVIRRTELKPRQVAPSYGQCGGSTNGNTPWPGPTACPAGQFCSTQNQYYAQCTPGSQPQLTSSPLTTSASHGLGCTAIQTSWGQCGGSAGNLPWACPTYPTSCPAGQFCSTQNQYYAQCTPGSQPLLTSSPLTTSASHGLGCTATQTSWGQCGGSTGNLPWACPTYPTSCPVGQFCSTQNQYYAQCTPGSQPQLTSSPLTTSASPGLGCTAIQTSWGQCGGSAGNLPWACPTYPTSCPAGQFCSTQNQYYAQCTPGSQPALTSSPLSTLQPPLTSSSLSTSQPLLTSSPLSTSASKPAPTSTPAGQTAQPLGSGCAATQTSWGQCGGSTAGVAWACPTYPTACPTDMFCSTQNPYYAQCTPGIATQQPPTTATPVQVTISQATTNQTSTINPTTTTTGPSSAASQAQTSGKVMYGGVNIAGCDFGCSTDGTCPNGMSGGVQCPPDGVDQMMHFVNDDGLNAFRIPTGWQFLVNGVLGGVLDGTNFPIYNALVEGCITSGASLCIIDIHNYARWNGAVIGQSSGAVTDEDFVSLWQQLAIHYMDQPQVAFGIMNEPHDLPSLTTWMQTVQKVVTEIRNVGATSQIILLPSTDWDHIDGTSEREMVSVTNPDGTYTNLVFDIHEYLDDDNSGQTAQCQTNRISDYTPFTAWLESNGRQAFLSETGGGDNQNCITLMCQQLSYLNSNSGQWLGWTGWAAGSFAASVNPNSSPYFSETPSGSPGAYIDHPLVTQCIAGEFNGNDGV